MKRWLLIVATLAMLGTVVAGCGDDDDDKTDSTPSGSSSAQTFTREQLESAGVTLVEAIADGDRDALANLLSGAVSEERIAELAACKQADMTFSNANVAVIVDTPTLRISGTIDATQGGSTNTRTIDWQTEVSEVSDGVYLLSAPPQGCPLFMQ